MTLTGGHIPDGCTLPGENKDFSTLLMDEAEVGRNMLVTELVKETEDYVPQMERGKLH